MEETFFEGMQELRRVDHLVFVSLKYTRSADIIKGVIKRIINAFDFVFDAILIKLKNEGKIEILPHLPAIKCKIILEHINDDRQLKRYIDFYLFLRKINKAEYKQFKEFRRNVHMICALDKKNVKVNIDIVSMYYKVAKYFLTYIKENYVEMKEFEPNPR